MIRYATMRQFVYFLCILIGLTACGNVDETPPGPYATDDLWLCKPEAESDLCLELDQTATWVQPDGSFEVMEHVNVSDPAYDCFYVYPTVDLSETPGNTEDLTDVEPMLDALYNQAARFTGQCNVYAPLYRQMTLGSYDMAGGIFGSEFFDIAFGDIDEAFDQYLLESGDRPFVLMGHSQGAHMLMRLLEERFDNDPEIRQRLVSALLIGPGHYLEVPEGETTGGTFKNLPLCTSDDETACIIAYDSIAAGSDPFPRNPSSACVNPTLLGGEENVLATTYWASDNGLPFPVEVTEPWVAYPEMHTAACRLSDGFLGIGTVKQDRKPPMTPEALQAVLLETLHITDVNYALGDLLRIVETQAENFQ